MYENIFAKISVSFVLPHVKSRDWLHRSQLHMFLGWCVLGSRSRSLMSLYSDRLAWGLHCSSFPNNDGVLYSVWKTNTFCWYFHFAFGSSVLLVYLLKHGLCLYKTCSDLMLSLIFCSNEADKNLCTIWLHKFLFHVLSRSQYSIPFCLLCQVWVSCLPVLSLLGEP